MLTSYSSYGRINCRLELVKEGSFMSLKEYTKKLKLSIPAIYLCLKDKDTPLIAKFFATITVGYALSPIDLIPDFIPILGYLDDMIVLPLLSMITLKLIPKEIYKHNYKEAESIWINGKPKKWYYAIPIVLIWIIILWCIIKNFI